MPSFKKLPFIANAKGHRTYRFSDKIRMPLAVGGAAVAEKRSAVNR
jgi:hypothetical protein